MARGDIPVALKTGAQGNKILARTPFEAVPSTIDFTNVDAQSDGSYVVFAGTPIGDAGDPMEVFKENTGTSESPVYKYAVGILLYDVYKDDPAGAILKKGYVDCTKAAASTGYDYDAAYIADAQLPMIVFENVVTE